MRSLAFLLLLIAACMLAAVSVRASENYASEVESAFLELETELDALLEQVPAPVIIGDVAPAVIDEPPALNTSALIKPVLDVTAALNPATEPAIRPVAPVLVPYNVPAENTPLSTVPDGYKAATVDPRFDPGTGPRRRRRGPNEAKVTFGPDVPVNYTKAKVSKNIFGTSAVIYRRAIDQNGCPCKKAVPQKYRYDARFKPEPIKYSRKCCCKDGNATAGANSTLIRDRLPLVARLKPVNATLNATVNGTACFRTNVTAPQVNITPEYYSLKRGRFNATWGNATWRAERMAKLCNVTAPAANVTVVPQFKRARRLTREERKKLREVVLHPVGQMP